MVAWSQLDMNKIEKVKQEKNNLHQIKQEIS